MNALRRLVRVAIIIALILVVGEGTARLVATFTGVAPVVSVVPPETWFTYSRSLGWQPRPGFRGTIERTPRAFDSEGFLSIDSPQIAAQKTFRVLFLGGSHTAGYGIAAESTFVERIETLVPNVQAINLGVIGYSTQQMRRVAETAIARLHPDLVVVETGVTDYRIVEPPDDGDGPARFESLYHAAHSGAARTTRRLERWYLYDALRRIARATGIVRAPATRIDVDSLHPRVSPAASRGNLTAIADMATRARAQVMLLTFGDSPFDTRDLRRGIDYFAQNQFELARAYLRVPMGLGTDLHIDGEYVARHYFAAALRASGDSAGAKTVSMIPVPRAGLFGGGPLFIDTVYHDVARAVARERGMQVVDVFTLLNAHPEVFVDHSGHINAAGHLLVAQLLAPHIAQQLPNRP